MIIRNSSFDDQPRKMDSIYEALCMLCHCSSIYNSRIRIVVQISLAYSTFHPDLLSNVQPERHLPVRLKSVTIVTFRTRRLDERELFSRSEFFCWRGCQRACCHEMSSTATDASKAPSVHKMRKGTRSCRECQCAKPSRNEPSLTTSRPQA